jgi:hypothetical protein
LAYAGKQGKLTRSKKTFILVLAHASGHGLDPGSGGRIKVFCFFSSEKKILPSA